MHTSSDSPLCPESTASTTADHAETAPPDTDLSGNGEQPFAAGLERVQALIEDGDGESALAMLDALEAQTSPEVQAAQGAQGAQGAPSAVDQSLMRVVRADALRLVGRLDEAAALYTHVAMNGGEYTALIWRRCGECLLEAKRLEEAMDCMRKSLALDNNDLEAHYLLGQMLFSSTLQFQAVCNARNLLERADDDTMLATAENIYRFTMMPYEAYQVVRRRAELGPPGAFLGLLLCGAQGICDWDTAEAYARELETTFYAAGNFATSREIPLYNIARVADEATNLAVAREAVKDAALLEPAFDLSRHWLDRPADRRLRLGLLSADFSCHPVIQLIIGLFEHLDKSRFELYAYDDGKNSATGEQRLLKVVDKHVDVREVKDADVARKVYEDNVDVLIDLMGITTKNRLGVLALRPCPVTAGFLGFPGTSGLGAVDYVITDKTITPDSSKPFYAEKLCRLPEVFMPNDNKRLLASNPVCRADLGLPEDRVVLCSFNRSFKLDKASVHLWMRILARTPNSVLWQKADEPNMIRAFQEAAEQHGVDPARLIFAGNTGSVPLHLARAGLADLGLDTLIYNGHTITADLLWAGVPVVTRRGTHFASRVSASLLAAVGLPDMVADSVQDMEDLAVALILNPARLRAVRERLAENRGRFPLFDTERYTRHFETALTMMLDRARQGLAADHLDVPVLPPRDGAFLDGDLPRCEESNFGNDEEGIYGDMGRVNAQQKTAYGIHYGGCPLCGAAKPPLGTPVTIQSHPNWLPFMPEQAFWLCCQECGHMYTNAFWDEPTLRALRATASTSLSLDALEKVRPAIGQVVRYLWDKLGGPGNLAADAPPRYWLDIGSQDGNWAMAASTFGFDVTALAMAEPLAGELRECQTQACGYIPLLCDINGRSSVAAVHDLEFTPYPELVLHHIHTVLEPGGFLLVCYDERKSAAARLYGTESANVLLQNPRRLHLFDHKQLASALDRNGFQVKKLFAGESAARCVLVARAKPRKTSLPKCLEKNVPDSRPDAE